MTWIEENGQNYFVYFIGQNSTVTDFSNYNFGRIPFTKEICSELNRGFFDLRNVFKTTITYSEQRKQRDLKYLQADYIKLILKFSTEFMKRKGKIFF